MGREGRERKDRERERGGEWEKRGVGVRGEKWRERETREWEKRGVGERGEREWVEGERREWAKKGNQRTQKRAVSGAFLVFGGNGKREGRWWWSGRMPNTKTRRFGHVLGVREDGVGMGMWWCSREGGADGQVALTQNT